MDDDNGRKPDGFAAAGLVVLACLALAVVGVVYAFVFEDSLALVASAVVLGSLAIAVLR